MFVPMVNWDKCSGCGACVDSCAMQCFVMSEGKSLAHRATYCMDCGNCIEHCPEEAIVISIGWGGWKSTMARR